MLLFALQLSNASGQYAVALIGAAFLAAYAIWRVYGLLIPGGILLVLGAGFASIYVIDALVRGPRDARWSALVPGAIFAAIGAGPAAERKARGRRPRAAVAARARRARHLATDRSDAARELTAGC